MFGFFYNRALNILGLLQHNLLKINTIVSVFMGGQPNAKRHFYFTDPTEYFTMEYKIGGAPQLHMNRENGNRI